MLQKHDEGMLLALCSKNNEPDVWDVFDQNPEMVLQRDHISNWKINWQPKSENIKALAKELNLGIDSFIFIDDNPLECSEVMTNCPEVLTLLLPKDKEQIPAFLQHVWAFDRFKVTEEDKKRTKMYIAERKRQEVQQSEMNLEDFLAGLELKMSMNFMEKANLARVSQLTQRTNQFNLSTIRRTEEEIEKLLQNEDAECWTIQVSDRFGDYGVVGVVITHKGIEELFIDTFLLSCRVLGRRVEDAILIGLKKYCQEYNLNQIKAKFYPTAKNTPFKEFLERTGWAKEAETAEYIKYSLITEKLADSSEFVELHINSNYSQIIIDEAYKQVAAVKELDESILTKIHQPEKMNLVISEKNWQLQIVNEENLLHRKQLLPLENYSGELLAKLPVMKINEQKLKRAEYIAPQDETEEKLVQIWSEILGVEKIGIQDNFFALGGHSLKATSLISKVFKEFHVELSLREIFKDPTIIKMAENIRGAEKISYKMIPVIEEKEYYPVSSAQKRVFLLNKIEGMSTAYNISGALKIEGEINYNSFNRAFKDLIGRHESLRTSFEMINEEIVQKVQQTVDFEVAFLEEVEGQVDKVIYEFIRSFDLGQAPLLRVGLIKCNDYHVLVYDMHHIISDGTSLGILIREFIQLYNGNQLPELRIQYKDFAVWQNTLFASDELKKQEEFWLQTFVNEIPILNMPTDYPRPAIMTYEGDRLEFGLNAELITKVMELGAQTGTTLYMTLLALYNVLLHKYTGQDDIVVGSPIAGRRSADLENILGMFVNTLAMRNEPQGAKSFTQFLDEVKENSLKAYENQDYQFEMLVEKLELRRDLSRNPIFDTMFTLQNMALQNTSTFTNSVDLKFAPYGFERKGSKFDLSLTASEAGNQINFNLEYSTKLFKRETIEKLSNHFVNLIENVVQNPDRAITDIQMISKKNKSSYYMNLMTLKQSFRKRKQFTSCLKNRLHKSLKEQRLYLKISK